MTSLTDVYDGGVGSVATRRRRVVGASLFVAGAAMVVGAIPIATTDLAAGVGLSVFEARKLAGVLAGLGLPAVFVGIFTVLPAGRATRGAAAIGASLALLGVALFGYAYPYNWVAANPAMAVVTTLLYSVGTLVTFWCLFVGVATFKTRTDPGGSARLEITDEGTIKVVSDDTAIPGMGGIGLFGREPDGDVDTQTNREETGEETLVAEPTTDEANPTQDPSPGRASGPTPAGDGAGAVEPAPRAESTTGQPTPAAADADVQRAVQERGSPDRYCGNCSHFEYVRADGDIAPYCGFHDELMEDMDACQQWDGNR
jgi:hypothetical protein